jgi:hypothetical protein
MFFLLLCLLLPFSQLFSGLSCYINRIYKSENFTHLLILSCILAVISTIISFSTMYFLGKYQNVIILQCMLIISGVISIIFINAFIIKERVYIGSYITLGAVVVILIIHHIMTRDFYYKSKK